MYQWIPPKKNGSAQKSVVILLCGAVLLFGITVVLPQIAYRWAFQLIALGLLTLSLFLVTRYLTRSYLYQITEDGKGGWDLEVVELTAKGKRRLTVCRISLGGISRLTLLDLSDGGKSETLLATYKKDKKRIYDYCVDFQPTKSCLILCREGGQEQLIRLEYDPTLFQLLSPTVREGSEDVEDAEDATQD